jgi:hypothetical protein
MVEGRSPDVGTWSEIADFQRYARSARSLGFRVETTGVKGQRLAPGGYAL